MNPDAANSSTASHRGPYNTADKAQAKIIATGDAILRVLTEKSPRSKAAVAALVGGTLRTGSVFLLALSLLIEDGQVHEIGGQLFLGPAPANNNADPPPEDRPGVAALRRKRFANYADLAQHGLELLQARGEVPVIQDRQAFESACVAFALVHTIVRTFNGKYAVAIPRPEPAIGRDYYPVQKDSIQDAVFNDIGILPEHCALYTDKGKARPLTEINGRISTVARKGFLYDGVTETSHLAADDYFHQQVWIERPVVCRRHTQSDLFFFAWGEDGRNALCDWVSCTKRELLSRPCLLLIIQGPTRLGKSMYVDGVGRLYRKGGAVPGEDIFSKFNAELIESPIVGFAEAFPVDFKERTISPAKLKEFVTCTLRNVADKNVQAAPLIGCTRSVLTANPTDFYSLKEISDRGSREALAARFLMVTAPELETDRAQAALDEAAKAKNASAIGKAEAALAVAWANHQAAAERVRAGAVATARDDREPTAEEIADAVTLGPAGYLKALGGRPFTDPHWIEGDGLFVSHLKFVQQTWVVPPERRGDSLMLKSNVEIAGMPAIFRKRKGP